jgi:hypothetical protein
MASQRQIEYAKTIGDKLARKLVSRIDARQAHDEEFDRADPECQAHIDRALARLAKIVSGDPEKTIDAYQSGQLENLVEKVCYEIEQKYRKAGP